MRRDGLILASALLLGAVPFFAGDYWVGLISQALIFGGFALGLDILVGYTRMPSLGHAAFFGLAGYGAALAITRWGVDPWLAAALGVLLAGLTALAFAPLAVRLRGLTFLTVTLAFSQVVWGLAIRWTSFTGGENGIPGVIRPSLAFAGWDLQTASGYYWFVLAVAAGLTLLLRRFTDSPFGLSLLGIRESDLRMAALGYDVHKRRVAAFVISAVVGGFYGVLSAYFNKFIGPSSLDWRLSAQMLLSVVVGGGGSLWGPLVAGAGIHILKTSLIAETQRWVMVLGTLYVITVVLLPDGLASIPDRLGLSGRILRRGDQARSPQGGSE